MSHVADSWIKKNKEVNEAFETNSVINASDEKLIECLQTLCTGEIAEPSIRYREIIRGITINHIQMSRIIKKLSCRNTILTLVVIILASLSVSSSVIQILIALGIIK